MTQRRPHWHWAALAGTIVVIVTATVTLASGALRSRQGSQGSLPPLVSTATPAAAPITDGAADSKVHFANPFDPSEVFEFPPGTSESDARQAVADILLQRARERGVPPSRSHHRTRR